MTATPPDRHADDPVHRTTPSDSPPSVDASAPAPPAADEATRQVQDTVRSISRLEESN